MLSIFGGHYKGKKLASLEEENLRPTSNFLRQIIFNVLRNHLDFENLRVLDLCAGCGTMGLEALSHGASFVLFVEKEAKHSKLLQENISRLALSKQKAQVLCKSIDQLHPQQETFALVFLDPPYGNACLINKTLENLSPFLTKDAIVVVECGRQDDVVFPSFLLPRTQKETGKTKLLFLQYNKVV